MERLINLCKLSEFILLSCVENSQLKYYKLNGKIVVSCFWLFKIHNEQHDVTIIRGNLEIILYLICNSFCFTLNIYAFVLLSFIYLHSTRMNLLIANLFNVWWKLNNKGSDSIRNTQGGFSLKRTCYHKFCFLEDIHNYPASYCTWNYQGMNIFNAWKTYVSLTLITLLYGGWPQTFQIRTF